ncbi:hypothetical protein NP493_1632g00000 [Ridgeia piscesae]|uniref:Uncharacterized protein n=1 Tax=Ridgeia piscesae TaxID=27915 RepID=A0AAD9JXR4_RIDPI|nr:hypothetical protein NP493_1632g00000 [Ridgeia piscesae]
MGIARFEFGWEAAAKADQIYGWQSYKDRGFYRNQSQTEGCFVFSFPDPLICENHVAHKRNFTHGAKYYMYVICPPPYSNETFDHCCGPKYQEYCCTIGIANDSIDIVDTGPILEASTCKDDDYVDNNVLGVVKENHDGVCVRGSDHWVLVSEASGVMEAHHHSRISLFLISVNSQERLRRGSSEKIILAEPANRNPYDFKMFLANDDNKKQPCKPMVPYKEWSTGSFSADLETKAHRLIERRKDCTNTVEGNGKVDPLKTQEKNPRFRKAFVQLGENWSLKPHALKQLEQFTCLKDSRNSSGRRPCQTPAQDGGRRRDSLTSKSKVDLARLPPCHSILKPHVQHVNHRGVALYK